MGYEFQGQGQKVRYTGSAPHRTAPHRTAPHRTAPHRTAGAGAGAGARAALRRLRIAKAILSSHTPARSSVVTDKDATAPD